MCIVELSLVTIADTDRVVLWARHCARDAG